MTVYAHGGLDEHAAALARLGAVIDGTLPSTRPPRRSKIVERGLSYGSGGIRTPGCLSARSLSRSSQHRSRAFARGAIAGHGHEPAQPGLWRTEMNETR